MQKEFVYLESTIEPAPPDDGNNYGSGGESEGTENEGVLMLDAMAGPSNYAAPKEKLKKPSGERTSAGRDSGKQQFLNAPKK